jgi:hypothetical protein
VETDKWGQTPGVQIPVAVEFRIIDGANAIGAKTVIVLKCWQAYPALPWDGAVAMR